MCLLVTFRHYIHSFQRGEHYLHNLTVVFNPQSTLKRREHLLENKFFECKCARCKDPTEFGTYTGALRCPKCKHGLVLSTDPLDPEATWSCNNGTKMVENRCPGYTITAKSMQLLISRSVCELNHEWKKVNALFLQDFFWGGDFGLQRRGGNGGVLAEVPQRSPSHALHMFGFEALAESTLWQDKWVHHTSADWRTTSKENGYL